jgi:hypothetical protein
MSLADLAATRSAAEWESRRDLLLADARSYLEQAPLRKFVYGATGVWRIWLRPGGWVNELLSAVTRNDIATLDVVRELLTGVDVGRELRKAQQELRSTNPIGIETRALGQLRSHSEEVMHIARAWLELHTLRREPESYTLRLIDNLRKDLERLYPTAKADVDRLSRDDDIRVRSTARFLGSSIDQMHSLFSSKSDLDVSEPSLSVLLNWELLRTDLPLSPELEPETPVEQTRAALIRLLNNQPTWDAAFESRCLRGDLEGASRILAMNEGDDAAFERLHATWPRHLDAARENFERHLAEARKALERGMAHGLLTESERAAHDDVLVRLGRELPDIRRFDIAHQSLTAIEGDVNGRRSVRVAALRQRLDAQPVSEEVRKRVEAALDAGDPLTAEEHLHLGIAGRPFVNGMASSDAFGDFFPEAFRTLYRFLEDKQPEVVIRSVHDQTITALDLRRVTGTQSVRDAEMLEAWFEAKRRRRLDENLTRTILSAIGLRVQEVRVVHHGNPQAGRAAASVAAPPAYLDLRTDPVRDRNEIPVEFFGSRANGRYRLLGVWGLPSEEELLTLVGDTNAHPATLVLYFGRMTEQRRRDLARLAHERRRTVVVLDEILLLFLCGHRGSRLPIFFKCALPFAHLEPYITTASLVPPEMFYGRERERDSIVDPNGPIFLYGGRQLGKTALLRHVERSYHALQQGSIVRWLDLRAEGIGYHAAIDEVWRVIARELRDCGVIGKLPSQGQADRVSELLRGWLNADPTRRILLLLDEADRFLAQDANDDFPVTIKLKSLMDETGRRFKIVFAGLHNVLRTTHQSNHPLGHFGDPIAIGPLLNAAEVRSAWGLIENPLTALGFRFSSPDLVLRILAHTNYYPSLIQLFCHHLLGHLHQGLADTFDARQYPPYPITASSVDDAYLSRELLMRFSNVSR